MLLGFRHLGVEMTDRVLLFESFSAALVVYCQFACFLLDNGSDVDMVAVLCA